MKAIHNSSIPIFVEHPVPIFLFKKGIKGMPANKPKALKNKANPNSASFSENFILISGIYNIQVPIKILMEVKTHAGAR